MSLSRLAGPTVGVGRRVSVGGWLGLLWVLMCTSCASQVHIHVKSSERTNARRPFYAMVREVSDDSVLGESYDSVAAKMFSKETDESILETAVIFPGKELHITVEPAEESDIVVYFFFTDYDGGAKWRVVLSDHPLPEEIFIELGRRNVERAGGGR